MDEQDIERLADEVIKVIRTAGVADSQGNSHFPEAVAFAVVGEVAGRFMAGLPEGRQDEGMKMFIQATVACFRKWQARPKDQRVFLKTAQQDAPVS